MRRERTNQEIFLYDGITDRKWPWDLVELRQRQNGKQDGRTSISRIKISRLPVLVDGRSAFGAGNFGRALIVEPEMHHVAIGDDVILAFQAEFSGVARARFTLARHIIGIGDGFGADETLLEIRMNRPRRLRRA